MHVPLCLEEVQAAGVPFPAAPAVREYSAPPRERLGYSDFAAMIAVLEGLAGRATLTEI